MGTRREFMRRTAAGLCAAVTPAAMAADSSAAPRGKTTWKRAVPVRYECDVAVAGGGMAGVSAALAAAKSGARVLLVENFAVTGGNATIGGVAAFCGETAGQGEAFDEIVGALQSFNAIAPYRPYPKADNRPFDHEILAFVLQELLLRRGVKLLLHTKLADARERGGRVAEITVCGPSGPEALRAKVFMDCTGEAQLTHLAGFGTVKGRPEDGLQLPMSMMFFVREAGADQMPPPMPGGWFERINTKEELPMTSVWPAGPGRRALKIKIPLFDATDTESLAAAEIRARRRMMSVLDYYRRVEKKNWVLDAVPPRIGIREGRRIAGRSTLTLADLRAGRAFDDGVARGVYYLDGHKPDDDKRTYILPPEARKVPPYLIPLGCLVPEGSKNLLAAGRCLSADQLALSSARVMTTCAMTGQAAGVTAALCAAKNIPPDQVDPAEVRRILVGRGANLEV